MGVRENIATGVIEFVVKPIKAEPALITENTVEIRTTEFYYIYPAEAYSEFKTKCQFCKKMKFVPCKTKSQSNHC
jgi:hypothetical protein